MSCTFAIANSPVFSPSSSSSSASLFCKRNPFSRVSSTSANPSSSSSSSSSSSCSSPSSSSLAFSTGFRASFSDEDVPSISSSSAPSVATVKRKRPARLTIPIVSLGLGAPAAAAATPMGPMVLEDERDGYYSVYCKRGKRRATMEDRYSAALNIHDDPKQALFGVYDGHGGSKAADFAAENLEKNIMDGVGRMHDDEDDAFKESVRHGYRKTDSDFLKENLLGGSCCVTALIRNGNLVVSNAGDCRAVVSRGGKAEALTIDHRPSREDEKDRIEATGGYVDCCHGVWRIQGSLAVSRGIGDGHLKKWVIAEPETRIHRIKADSEFLILASDGLWDKVTDQEAVDIARPLCLGKNTSESLAACRNLAEISAARGSLDDISVMLIQLERYT